MKKTLLALVVLTAAGSANAGINLYDANGVKVDLSGAAEVQYRNTYNPFDDAELRLDDGDLMLNTTVAITDELNVISGVGFAYENNADTDAQDVNVINDELWAGFSSSQFGAITFGRQLLVSDDSGIGKDYELGSEGIDFVQTAGSQVIKYVYDNGTFYAGASTDLRNSDESISGTNPDGSVSIIKDKNTRIWDARVGFRTNGLDTRVYFYDGDHVGSTGQNIKGYNLEAEYALGNVGLAASFGQIEYKTGSKKTEGNVYQIAADYTMDKTTFALGYNNYDVKSGDDVYALYANVTQKLHSNVKVYAEVGHSNADFTIEKKDPKTSLTKGADFGYVAGIEVTF
ncbi:porin [Photobacterium piscicola]|uniref:Porin n=1 Tax=Photobacterium piscicola TaxID=1378299 RepID=A0ABU6LDF1_9GAMM|nr:porin [Photobacterium piscicola]